MNGFKNKHNENIWFYVLVFTIKTNLVPGEEGCRAN
jgi:hypothetical protein